MPDRIPLVTIPGQLTPFVGVDFLLLTAGAVGDYTLVLATVTDPPLGGTVVIEVNDAVGGQGGGVNGITVTIADGAQVGTNTGTITLTGSEAVYMRITGADADAQNLSGYFEFTGTQPTSNVALTNLTLVKRHAAITVSTYDTDLTDFIAAVSDEMQRYMDRTIMQTALTDVALDGMNDASLVLPDWPILSSPALVLRDGTSVIDATTYEVELATGIIHYTTAGGATLKFRGGLRNYRSDYTTGYAVVPSSLVNAATKQVRHEWHQSVPSKRDRLGEEQKVGAGGGSTTTFTPDDFLPSTLRAMSPFKRWV